MRTNIYKLILKDEVKNGLIKTIVVFEMLKQATLSSHIIKFIHKSVKTTNATGNHNGTTGGSVPILTVLLIPVTS